MGASTNLSSVWVADQSLFFLWHNVKGCANTVSRTEAFVPSLCMAWAEMGFGCRLWCAVNRRAPWIIFSVMNLHGIQCALAQSTVTSSAHCLQRLGGALGQASETHTGLELFGLLLLSRTLSSSLWFCAFVLFYDSDDEGDAAKEDVELVSKQLKTGLVLKNWSVLSD